MTCVTTPASPLQDGFGRRISYLRLSVTDRCDLRCRYCMAEDMAFLPRAQLLSIDEMALVAERMIHRGIRKIRLTGGEPLVRGGVMTLVSKLGRLLGDGLEELTLTTNGMRLADHAPALVEAGVRRVNVSLDTRDPERFRHITRWGELDHVLGGIEAARAAGLSVKINMVALKGVNDGEISDMLSWCGTQGHELTLIETMPLGVVDEDRTDRYLPLDHVRKQLEARFTLVPSAHRTGGPARYFDVRETGSRLGLITPMTNNFCEGCNRIRLTASGYLYTCLGHDDGVDLREAFREEGVAGIDGYLDAALRDKPRRHDFRIATGAMPAIQRHMSVTGG